MGDRLYRKGERVGINFEAIYSAWWFVGKGSWANEMRFVEGNLRM
jgi:hypothetical protein